MLLLLLDEQMSKSIPKLFVLMTLMGIFVTVGLLPAFADSGAQTVPLSPTGLNATAVSDTQTYLTWNAPINATQSGITGYQIQRNGTVIVNDTQSTQTSLNYAGLIPGGTVVYRVAAWNSMGLGLPSNPVLGTSNNLVDPTPVNDTNLPPVQSTNSTQTIDETQPTTNQISLPTTNPTTTDPTTLPTTDPTSTLPDMTGVQPESHHYDLHRFYAGNQTMSHFAHLKLDRIVSQIHHDVLSSGQEHKTLGTYRHTNSAIQTQHVDHKSVSSFVQKYVESRYWSQGIQKQVFTQHKTQSQFQPSAFKQDVMNKNISHFNNIGFHYSPNNVSRVSMQHTFQSHVSTQGSLFGMNHRMLFNKSQLGNNT